MRLLVSVLPLVAFGCVEPTVLASRSPTRGDSFEAPLQSRMFPDVGAFPGQRGLPPGVWIRDGVRVTIDSSGIARGDEVLEGHLLGPSVRRLPERLGGGYLFSVQGPSGLGLWTSPSFTGKLRPLVSQGGSLAEIDPIVFGFDRIYVRFRSSPTLAIDPETGKNVSLDLPVAPNYGKMVFLDAWRAVVEADIRGVLATYDGGRTWRQVPVDSSLRGLSTTSGDIDDLGDALLETSTDILRLGRDGSIDHGGSLEASAIDAAGMPAGFDGRAVAREFSLKLAIERGVQSDAEEALVLADGALRRVSLPNGGVLESRLGVRPSSQVCVGVSLARFEDGLPVGFVCSEPGGATEVLRVEPDLALTSIWRSAEPRRVVDSAAGTLAVSGGCESGEGLEPDVICLVDAEGRSKELRLKGNVSGVRVVPLSGDRTALIIPPRGQTQGQLSILSSGAPVHRLLGGSDLAPGMEYGVWVDPFVQTAEDEIGGFVEGGGRVWGVTLKVDGAMTVSRAMDAPFGVSAAVPRGLIVGTDGRIFETADVGRSWTDLTLPNVSTEEEVRGEFSSHCSRLGCTFPGWVRFGWGEPAGGEDFPAPEQPETIGPTSFRLSSAPVRLRCETASLLPDPPRSRVDEEAGWTAFLGVPPPKLGPKETGYQITPDGPGPMQFLAWGPSEGDWTPPGKMQFRFADLTGMESFRASTVTAAPWRSQSAAALAFGATHGIRPYWMGFRDGDAILAGLCSGKSCTLFSAAHKTPIQVLGGASDMGFKKPSPNDAVRTHSGWAYLTDGDEPNRTALMMEEGGRVTQKASLVRTSQTPGLSTDLRLVRRAHSDEVGLMFTYFDGAGDKRGERFVLPIDRQTGAVSEPVSLGSADLRDVALRTTCDRSDGWLRKVSNPLHLTLDGRSTPTASTDLLLLFEGSSACLERGVLETRLPFEKPSAATRTPARGQGPEPTWVVVGAESRRPARCVVDAAPSF